MTDYDDNFFDELRPWSRLKNRILGSYMSPYMAKVSKLRKRIVLIDAFAGAGRFSDGTAGSPLIICQAAERYAKGNYDAYFFNTNPAHHKMLKSILDKQGLASVNPILGDAIDQLRQLIADLRDETLFLYIDPYGLNCEFDVLRPLLERDKSCSTEILINLHMPITHRLGGRHKVQRDGIADPQIQSYHDKLRRVYGGDYWQDILLWREYDDAKDRERALVNLYREKLSSTGYLTFTGACPIREKTDSATKYAMIFASPHPDALLLLNDEMCKSFNDHVHSHLFKDTLFADSSWSDLRNPTKIRTVALEYVKDFPLETRLDIWRRIVGDHFMQFTKSEFGRAIQGLFDSGEIECVTPIKKGGTRPTKRLNDKCVFRVGAQQGLL